MGMSLAGHVALVTGASQGIGQACALRLAESGAAVAVAARNREKLSQLVDVIAAAGGKALALSVICQIRGASRCWPVALHPH